MAALASDTNRQGRETIIEGTIIREPDVREGRAAYIVRAQTVNGSPATGLVLVVDYRQQTTPPPEGDRQSGQRHSAQTDAQPVEYGDRVSARGRLQ